LREAPKCWLLDFDNTLAALEVEVDWNASRRALEPMLRAAGVDASLFAQIPKGNLPLYAALHARFHAAPGGIDPSNRALLAAASALIEDYELAGVKRAQPLPGALKLLRKLRGRAAIVTSNSSRTVARWMDIHSIDLPSDRIIGRDSELALKPSPRMVEAALQRMRSGPQEALLLGDSLADLQAARAAAVRFAGIGASSLARQRLQEAGTTEVFVSPAAFLSWIESGWETA